MKEFKIPKGYTRIKCVRSFQELLTTPFVDGVNALCWPRELVGDFEEIIAHSGGGEGVVSLELDWLANLPVSPAGKVAIETLMEDHRLLREHEFAPVINCIHEYPRDDTGGVIATDVFSFHADSAPVETDTWLCTYCGPSSEGLRDEEARKRVDIPETREALLTSFCGRDDAEFLEYLNENCYDLHYAPIEGAIPFSFGVGNMWRLAVDWPGSPVPPCIHRAPESNADQPPRLILIS